MHNEVFLPSKTTFRGNITIVKSIVKQQLAVLRAYWGASLMSILIPLMFVLIPIMIGRSVSPNYEQNFQQNTGATDAEAYLVIGAVFWAMMVGILWDFGTYLREEQFQGTLESVMVTPVSRYVLALGRGLFSLTFGLVSSFISITIGLLIFSPDVLFSFTFVRIMTVFLLIIVSYFPMIGMSLLVGTLVIKFKDIESVINLLQWVLGTLMGVFFSIAALPWGFRVVALLFPPTWGLNDARAILLSTPPVVVMLGFSNYTQGLLLDTAITLAIGIFWSLVGFFLFIRILEHAKKGSGLGEY